ncbi:MAG TPA: type 4a pilus biogenesis protein PilO [Patescibacteria group bacterium]|nr:type 4a pilus biogenesis protein PilO [Patescibacteria group bacterium]
MKLTLDKNFLKSPTADKYLAMILPRIKEKKVQSFTTIVLTLITFSIFSIFAISPTLGTITDLQKQIDDDQYVMTQLQQKITNLSLLQDQYTSIKNEIPAVLDGIPQTPDITSFLGQVQQIANSENITVERVQTLPVDLGVSPLKYTAYAFAIDLTGTYSDSAKFMNGLTNFNRLITIDALSFTKNTRLSDTYRLSIRGQVYFQP